jgi:protocatechuate 3,4-dioxygenase beta subunit
MSDHHDHDEHREGLGHDLPQMQDKGMVRRPVGRRGLLGVFGGIGAATLVACGTDSDSTTITSSSSTSAAEGGQGPAGGMGAPPSGGPGGGGAGMDVSQEGLDDGDIPEETGGPYPGDGSNGVNVLTESGIVREDLRSSFGDASGVAEGVPLSIQLKVYDNGTDGLAPYVGAAVYLWHCDREGRYSLYSDGVTGENYLRGVQVVGEDGSLTFTSIFPACYSGRWPHLHFEVYPSVDDATTASNKLRTSQIAFPEDVCQSVYSTAEGYDASVDNLAQVSLDSDGIFSDGYSLQLATLTGSVDEGYTLKLNVPV